MAKQIREKLSSLYDENLAQNITVLYGGSVKPENAKEIFATTDVDGALVGGASLKINEFEQIIKSI